MYPGHSLGEPPVPDLPRPDDPPDGEYGWENTRERAAIERGIHSPARTGEVLFDLHYDPVERVNVADDPRYGAVRNRLSARLDGWMERTDDPLLDGSTEQPPEHE